MIVVESGEIKNMERAAQRKGTSLATLMEQAGAAVAELAATIITRDKLRKITVFCGNGNNGGDGFVIARFLSLMCDVTVILANGDPRSDLAKLNYNILPDKIKVVDHHENRESCAEIINESDMIIDAIYGIGFHDVLDPYCTELVVFANRSKAVKIAVDIPSGIISDSGEVPGECFHADYTV